MKKLITILLLAPITTFAQKIDLSILGGGSFTSVKSNKFDKKSSISPFGSIQGAYHLNSFSIGMRADFFKIKGSILFHTINNITGNEYDAYIASNLYNPGANISLFSNYNIPLGRSNFFFGVNAGYIFSLSSSISYEKYPEGTIVPPIESFDAGGSANGLTFGIHVGYEYNISKLMKLKAELSPRYIYSMNAFGEKDDNHEFSATSIPLSVGIGFSL